MTPGGLDVPTTCQPYICGLVFNLYLRASECEVTSTVVRPESHMTEDMLKYSILIINYFSLIYESDVCMPNMDITNAIKHRKITYLHM